MKNQLIWIILPLLFFNQLNAEENAAVKGTEPIKTENSARNQRRRVDQKKGTWSFQWGYNRDYYTPSDITFKGQGYNFTIHDVVARDKPEKLNSRTYLNPHTFDIPQFNSRISYYFTDRLNISFGQDHMKYVMRNNQPSSMSGYISPLAIQRAALRPSPKSMPYLIAFPGHVNQYTGYHSGETINVSPDLLEYEHTDGLNYFFVDLGYTIPLWVSGNGKHAFSLVSSIGAGPVLLRSDVRLFGEGKNNRFHASGYAIAAYSAIRIELFSSFFIEGGGKGGYIDLQDVLVNGKSKDRASQQMGFLEKIIYVGFPFKF